MAVKKLKAVEANDGSYGGAVLAAFDKMTADEVRVPRALAISILDALKRFGTHMEYDSPGDAMEPCGQWCDICNCHIDDENHADGHDINCVIEKLRAAIAN